MWSLLLLGLFATHIQAIWPIPSSLSMGEDVLFVERSVQFVYNGAVQVYINPREAAPPV
jgi:hypothetical protein